MLKKAPKEKVTKLDSISKVKRVDITLDFMDGAPVTNISSVPSYVRNSAPSIDEGDFDIAALIDEVLNSELAVPIDVKINDSAMKLAPNFVTFLADAEYMDFKAFSRQNEIGTKLFSEYCPHCTDMEWFNNVPVKCSLKKFLKHVQLLDYGVCPKCGARKSELFKSGDLKHFQELAACAGQRSAKSHTVALLAAYIVHWYLKLQKPWQLFKLSQGTTLHATFVALTYGQAKETLWDPFYEYVSRSPWFQRYHAMLDAYNEKSGDELYKFKDTFILYRHRGLLIYPSGPNKKTLRGRTRFFASIDELGWFNNEASKNKVKDNADEVYIALERSLLTVRAACRRLIKKGYDNIPTAFFVNVSSPSHARDKIMELVKKAQFSKKILAFHHPTWEMNPNIIKEDLEDEYIKNPEDAERDYGANPPLTHNPFMRDYTALEDAQHKKNPIKLFYKQRRSRVGDLTRYGKIEVKPGGFPSILAIDAGHVNNSFACVVGHLDLDTLMPVIDVMVEMMALPGIPLNYSLIYEHILVPLIKERNVKLLTADRWQSIKIMDDVREQFEIDTERYSLRYDDMILVKDYLYSGDIRIPKFESDKKGILEYAHSEYPVCFAQRPIDHFILQCLTIQDTGNQIIKGENLTDDLWRAFALANSFLLDEDYRELFTQPEERKGVPGIGAFMNMMKSGIGGGGSSPQLMGGSCGTISSGKALGVLGKKR